MTSAQRAENLFSRAAKAGLDGPTEGQVHEAIHDAEEEVYRDILMLFMESKHPEMADWLEKKLELRQLDAEPTL